MEKGKRWAVFVFIHSYNLSNLFALGICVNLNVNMLEQCLYLIFRLRIRNFLFYM